MFEVVLAALITGLSSNPALVPHENITESEGVVTITPVVDAGGTAKIRLYADGARLIPDFLIPRVFVLPDRSIDWTPRDESLRYVLEWSASIVGPWEVAGPEHQAVTGFFRVAVYDSSR